MDENPFGVSYKSSGNSNEMVFFFLSFSTFFWEKKKCVCIMHVFFLSSNGWKPIWCLLFFKWELKWSEFFYSQFPLVWDLKKKGKEKEVFGCNLYYTCIFPFFKWLKTIWCLLYSLSGNSIEMGFFLHFLFFFLGEKEKGKKECLLISSLYLSFKWMKSHLVFATLFKWELKWNFFCHFPLFWGKK